MPHKTLENITRRVIERSRPTRRDYLARMQAMQRPGPARAKLSCGNLAHGFAAAAQQDKPLLSKRQAINIGIVSAYNDMLSAHQPFAAYPMQIKLAAREAGATAQVAGGVPAMCDGVTQGQAGMELSLFSRDVIAMATAIALSHDMFDAVMCLGVCDKIVPGMLIGALSFGHLPVLFVPAGPMPSGLSNTEKSQVRKRYAEGKASAEVLLEAEAKAYHAPGTCTFYGTANSNQMLMEIMGLMLPGAAFENPRSPERSALTRGATRRLTEITALGDTPLPLAEIVDEKAIINAITGLLATGGSTNHTLHLVAIARAAGIIIDWDDFAALSQITPLLARIYPNGDADVNQFHAAGGMPFLIRELLDAGLLHETVNTVMGPGLRAYTRQPTVEDSQLRWRDAAAVSGDTEVLRPVSAAFSAEGGLKVLNGNLGRSVIKISAISPAHHRVEAPCVIFHDQRQMQGAFERGELDKDLIAVIRFQGPAANGMPELHRLTPVLGLVQDRGYQVALVTDGRMSGASGRVPAAIHVTPEAMQGGPLAKLRDGDVIRLDAGAGVLEVLLDEAALAGREAAAADLSAGRTGMGRELFSLFRREMSPAETGASVFGNASD